MTDQADDVRVFVMADNPYVATFPREELHGTLVIDGVEYQRSAVDNHIAGPWIVYARQGVSGSEAQKAVAAIMGRRPHDERVLAKCVMGGVADGGWLGVGNDDHISVSRAGVTALYRLSRTTDGRPLYVYDDGERGELLPGD